MKGDDGAAIIIFDRYSPAFASTGFNAKNLSHSSIENVSSTIFYKIKAEANLTYLIILRCLQLQTSPHYLR
jgi:hypothetical protein